MPLEDDIGYPFAAADDVLAAIEHDEQAHFTLADALADLDSNSAYTQHNDA